MTDERIEGMVATTIDKIIGANRDFELEINDTDSSILGTMQKSKGLTVSIRSFVEETGQPAESDFCEDDVEEYLEADDD